MSELNRYVCVHGHFYQPPRENAWLEEVEQQDSAYPYHDWNERITAESYAPNTASRILDEHRRIVNIVNNYSKISFNFGPTLLSWIARHAPEVLQALVEADRESQRNFSGHGSAIAQVYNHMIMPLANRRDKRTQVIWGIKDFEFRFGRKPEGMWLSETAVDVETLEVLAEQGIAFTILAPRQARRARGFGKRWRDVSGSRIDPKQPFLCRLPSGKTIALFFYDGPVSRAIAFEGLLSSGEALGSRLVNSFVHDRPGPQLAHIATDGETYGHHHVHGDMALSYCLNWLEANNLARITVYGEYLERFPPTQEVEIIGASSWSCIHGIERWRSDCGCNSGRAGWNQAWRAPLRRALDWLRDELALLYERQAGMFLRVPWDARDAYIDVILDRSIENVDRFLASQAARELTDDHRVTALRLLEMQRHGMLMFTSCGWFFDEISGLETTQILQYAARAIQLAELASGVSLEENFVDRLSAAPSNIPDFHDGRVVYETLVKPATVDMLRVGAHYAVSSLFEDYQETAEIYCYVAERELIQRDEAGRQKLVIGKAHLRSNITWASSAISFAVLHFGDNNLVGGVRKFLGKDEFETMRLEIKQPFFKADIPEILRLIDQYFESHKYSLWHLFRDEQRKVFDRILGSTLAEIEASFRSIYSHHYPIMQVLREMKNPIPKGLITAAEFTINANLRDQLESAELDLDQLRHLTEEVKRWSFEVDQTLLSFIATGKVTNLMSEFLAVAGGCLATSDH